MPNKADKELKERWMQFEGSYRLKCKTAKGNIEPNSPSKRTTLKLSKQKTSNTYKPYTKKSYTLDFQALRAKRVTIKENQSHCVQNRNQDPPIPPSISIQGPQWDGQNLTCALDTVIACIQHLYSCIKPTYKEQFINMSPWIHAFVKSNNINSRRDQFLQALHIMNPDDFPMGPHPKSLTDVADSLFNSSIDDCFIFTYYCVHTQQTFEKETNFTLLNIPYDLASQNSKPQISTLVGSSHRCIYCRQYHQCQSLTLKFTVPILLISYDVTNYTVALEKTLETNGSTYHIRSIMYYKDGHFTCALFLENDTFWYDGMKNNGVPTLLHNVQNHMSHNDHCPVLLLYSL